MPSLYSREIRHVLFNDINMQTDQTVVVLNVSGLMQPVIFPPYHPKQNNRSQ